MIGPTEIGRIVSVDVMIPAFFGRPVTIVTFSAAGMFSVRKQREVIIVRRRRPYSGTTVVRVELMWGSSGGEGVVGVESSGLLSAC
jgi:hypothetical protein